MLELEEDGATGAEPPGYEDYADRDPASRERFGPAEREELVIQAPQVMLGRTATPPPATTGRAGTTIQGPRGCLGGSEPFSLGFSPARNPL